MFPITCRTGGVAIVIGPIVCYHGNDVDAEKVPGR